MRVPASPGVKDWQPSAWSPRTRLLYIPHQNLCQDAQAAKTSYIAGHALRRHGSAHEARARGAIGASSRRGIPSPARSVWNIKEDLPVWSGALVTAGDVAFYGTMDGWFKAVDARSGAVLWQFKTGSGIIGQPMTLSRSGRQAVRRGAVGRRRLGRRNRRRATRRSRCDRSGRLRERHGGPAAEDHPGRHAVCLRASLTRSCSRSRSSPARWRAAPNPRPRTTSAPTLRICAHPDNLPFSAQDESGFDNRIARVLANELRMRLEYTWLQPQHGLVRKTIGAGLCDAILGLPEGYEGVARTAPYYRSRYVFITPRDARIAPSFDDAAFLEQRIGVQLIGDDMAATPPGHALARARAPYVVGFPVYGEKPAVARMVDAIATHRLDAGVAWGPAAGYFAAHAAVPLAITPALVPATCICHSISAWSSR